MIYVEGKDRDQSFITSLNDMIAKDSPARIIDKFVDVCDLDELGFNLNHSELGRPPYDPAMMSMLYLYGYYTGIRSSRKLERETQINVEVMWLMSGLKPDFKTIAEFRRKNHDGLNNLFHKFNSLCNEWGLIGGKLIAVDGTKIKASNNKKNNFSKAKLEQRLQSIDEYLKELDEEDKIELATEETTARKEKRKALEERRATYEGYKEQLDESGENEISIVDPDARLMGNNRGGVDMAYNIQSAVDSKHHLIVDYEVTMNPSDHHQLSNMVKKVQSRFKLKKFTVLADKGYYNGKDLEKVKKLKVKAIVSRQKPSNPKGQPSDFHTDKFIYDLDADNYTCPMGKRLHPHNKKTAKRRAFYNKTACRDCPNLDKCTTGERKYRTITRGAYSDIYHETDRTFKENIELYKLRQQIVEHPFGTVKRAMNGHYFLLRTKEKVSGEVALLFLGYNLKRVINILGFEEIMKRLEAFSAQISTIFEKLFLIMIGPKFIG